jgi:hypothetical protein
VVFILLLLLLFLLLIFFSNGQYSDSRAQIFLRFSHPSQTTTHYRLSPSPHLSSLPLIALAPVAGSPGTLSLFSLSAWFLGKLLTQQVIIYSCIFSTKLRLLSYSYSFILYFNFCLGKKGENVLLFPLWLVALKRSNSQ